MAKAAKGEKKQPKSAEFFTWPDGGTTPFRGEKATNWEGGFRVPLPDSPSAMQWKRSRSANTNQN